jgi:hypothetical protein
MTWRVNYGNGQVSNDFDTKHEALNHITAMDQYREFAFIQFYADGEWFRICKNGKVKVCLW